MIQAQTKILEKLISFRTEEGNHQAKKQIVEYCRALLSKAGFKCKVTIKNNIYTLLAANRAAKVYDYLLVGHLDVVPANDQTWKYSEDKTFFYGRGTLDMKGGCAVMLERFIALRKTLLKSSKNIALVLVTDEELGSKDGLQVLVKEGLKGKFVYIPDTGGGLDTYISEGKGFLFLQANLSGTTAHGCRPWNGDNAILKVNQAISKLLQKFPIPKTDQSGWKATTLNIGKISGGNAINTIPHQASFTMDFRFHPAVTNSKKLLAEVKKVLKPFGQKLKLSTLHSFDGFMLKSTGQDFQTYSKICQQRLGHPMKLKKEYGSNDGRFFTGKNVTLVMTGPFGYGYHGDNEKVYKQELINMSDILGEFLQQVS